MPRHSESRPAEGPRVKRPRAAQACERCRAKKYKCDELYPCAHCKKSQIKCIYQGNHRQLESDRSVSYVLDLEKKVEELSSKLRKAELELKLKLSPSHKEQKPVLVNPSLSATPSSLPLDKTPPSVHDLEEPLSPCGDDAEDEVTELNHHTNGIEFHGSTSSVAFLGHLRKARDPRATAEQWPHKPPAEYSLVSTLHNSSFSPTTDPARSLAALYEQNYYLEHAHIFMSGYFENIHVIHPLIDKEDFYLRAHDLWLRRTTTPDPSFVALYLSVLSFGALLRVWDEVQLGGLTRFEWSRKLFGEAQLYLNHLHFMNNLDAVQCLYLMAKICQNELNPNLAYMYLGLAIRTCLAAGFNRNVRHSTEPRAEWISKTWWGLFSLEIEMSFSLGRPDTLGMDEYHNRPLPPRDDTQYAIIPWMVDFARLTRKVSVQIYHSRLSLREKLFVALAIESEMDTWIAQLPEHIRPDFVTGLVINRNALRDPKWARRQRVVLGIRYYNVKMLLFRPFLSHFTSFPSQLQTAEPELRSTLVATVSKCLEAAEKTITIIHDIYRLHTFFRCWWYNTTYVTFATSTLLLPLSRPSSLAAILNETPSSNTDTISNSDSDQTKEERNSLHKSIAKSLDILDATDECVVARKCTELIRFYLREFEAREADSPSCSRSRLHIQNIDRPGNRYINRERDGDHTSVPHTTPPHASGSGPGPGHDHTINTNTNLNPFSRATEKEQEPEPEPESERDRDGWIAFDSIFNPETGFRDGFDIPEWAYGFGFPDYSFEGIGRFFDTVS
ncbi:fungal-specific transcription factor domain-containing protein [Aspergillus egyptiacus]|nr:fungal-specific transcription factor domain-containing protein [Aspergillus egyptiacus]